MRLPLLFSMFIATQSYKYLVYSPLFAHSHSNFLGKIADTLTDAGHDVTVLMPIIDETLENKTGVHKSAKVIFVEQDPRVKDIMGRTRTTMLPNLWTSEPSPYTMFKLMKNSGKLIECTCEKLFKQTSLLNSLKEEKFDVGIIQPQTACGFALFRKIGLNKTIGAISTVGREVVSYHIGEPFPSSYVPSMTVTQIDQMSFFERLKNSGASLISHAISYWLLSGEIKQLKEIIGDDSISFEEMIAQQSFVFTNSNPYLNYPRPKLHKTIEIGGIAVNTDKDTVLDEKWDKILGQRPQTVLISFGTIAKSKDMPDEWKHSIISVCGSMPNTTFIWKYEGPTTIADNLENVYLPSWLPQKALLSDPRLSLFITHGGLGSTTEVAYYGKPAIMIPLFSEQPRNANMLARHGGAVVLKKKDLGDPEILRATLEKVISDKSYKNAAQRLSDMLRSQPVSAKDLVVKHAEFVAKYGPLSSLDPYGRHLSIFQYYLLDVFAAVILALIILFTLVIYCVKFVFCRLCGSPKMKVD